MARGWNGGRLHLAKKTRSDLQLTYAHGSTTPPFHTRCPCTNTPTHFTPQSVTFLLRAGAAPGAASELAAGAALSPAGAAMAPAVAPSGESRVRDKLQPLQVHAQPDPQRFDVALLQGPEAVKLQLPTAKTE